MTPLEVMRALAQLDLPPLAERRPARLDFSDIPEVRASSLKHPRGKYAKRFRDAARLL